MSVGTPRDFRNSLLEWWHEVNRKQGIANQMTSLTPPSQNPAYEPDDGPLSPAYVLALQAHVRVQLPRGKLIFYEDLLEPGRNGEHCHATVAANQKIKRGSCK